MYGSVVRFSFESICVEIDPIGLSDARRPDYPIRRIIRRACTGLSDRFLFTLFLHILILTNLDSIILEPLD